MCEPLTLYECVSLELMTYVSEGCSLALVSSNALPVLLKHVANSNRSSASLLVVQSTIRILLNLTKVDANGTGMGKD